MWLFLFCNKKCAKLKPINPQAPVINNGVQNQQQQMNINNSGMLMQEPMAANEGFGAFSSF